MYEIQTWTWDITKLLFLQSRELEIAVYWRDWRELCAVKFLRLDDFLDNERHGMCLSLEPQGTLFAEVNAPDFLFQGGPHPGSLLDAALNSYVILSLTFLASGGFS